MQTKTNITRTSLIKILVVLVAVFSIGIFIAQEVQKHFPEIVYQKTNSDYLELEYEGLIPILTASIKERDFILQDLAKQISQLEKTTSALTKTKGKK